MEKEKPEKPKPRVTVTERQFQTSLDELLQHPFGQPDTPIAFKDPSVVGHWFNANARPGRIHEGKQRRWWPVTPDQVADPDTLGMHHLSPEGYVVRGERGHEILMAKPRDEAEQVQVAKTRANMDRMRSPHRQRDEVVAAASAQLGDQAAEFLNRTARATGTVQTTLERVERIEQE